MARAHKVNAIAQRAPKGGTAALLALPTVYVTNPLNGLPKTTIKQSTPNWAILINTSWALRTVDFIVTYKPGAPVNKQIQQYVFPGGGYGASVAVLFGVPPWANNAMLGPAVLTVLVNGVSVGSYNFTVVA